MTVEPSDFRKDSRGNLVHKSNIKTIDLLRDDLVNQMVAEALSASQILSALKTLTLTEINDFVEMSAGEYGVSLGGKKGNISLVSFTGDYKIIKAISEHIIFDERLMVAKELVDQCIADWSEGVNDNLRKLIDKAFQTNSQGKVSTGRILELRRLDITDPKWKQAMEAIADSIKVNDSTTYIRFYKRVGETDQYTQIPLDLASVPLLHKD